MEDVFEALIGVSYTIFNKYLGHKHTVLNEGPGFTLCYNMVSQLLEQVPMIQQFVINQRNYHQGIGNQIIDYNLVNDPNSILKEMMEYKVNTDRSIGVLRKTADGYHQNANKRILQAGNYKLEQINHQNNGANVFHKAIIQIYHIPGKIIKNQDGSDEFVKDPYNQIMYIGQFEAPKQDTAFKLASDATIKYLISKGFEVKTPKSYILPNNKYQFNEPPPDESHEFE